jgi:GNAT superfamily N-acetyltransferase
VSSTRSRTDELEAVGYELWLAPDVTELDGWRLRFAHGVSGRANSVWPNGEGVLPLEEKVQRVEEWYRAHGAPVMFQLTGAARTRELGALLAARGYEWRSAPVSVQVAQLDRVLSCTRGEADVSPALDDDWLELWAGARGFDRHDVARDILTAGDVAFARVENVAVGRGVVVGDWLGITAMITLPQARRQGHGRAILHTLAQWGTERACTRAILQVDLGSGPALALYAGAGFAGQHEYRYRILQ